MNFKVICITGISIILYTFFLFCIGLFGENLQNYAITGAIYALKYGLVLLGFILTIFLPYRINKALIQRNEERYQRESEARIRMAAEKEKQTQEKILEEMYVKNEDAV